MSELEEANIKLLTENLKDKYWRMNNLYHIVTKGGKKVKFKMNELQERMYAESVKHNRLVILKARQQTVSSFWIIYFLDQCLFVRNWRHRTIADKKENLSKLFQIARYAYNHLHPALKDKMPLVVDNVNEVRFGHNNSHFMITLETHSEPVDSLHLSEVAFMNNPESIDETLQAVPNYPRTFIVFESIPNGIGNYFHSAYMDAQNNRGSYHPIFFPWHAFSEYREVISDQEVGVIESSLTSREKVLFDKGITINQIAWRRYKLADFKGVNEEDREKKFLVKYPEDDFECFQTSGSNAFNTSFVDFYMKNRLQEPIKRMSINSTGVIYDDVNGDLYIFDEPRPGHSYVAGADVAKGMEKGDYSALYVLNKKTGQPVAKLHYHETPQMFGIMCAIVCKYYNSALLSIEKNDRGHAAIMSARNYSKSIGFNNFYYVGMEHGLGSGIIEYGFHTNAATKPTMISNLSEEFETGYFLQLDAELLGQMKTYLREKNDSGRYTYNAAKGYHDDCICAIAIALQMLFLFPTSRLSLDDNKNVTTEDIYMRSLKNQLNLTREAKSEKKVFSRAIF